MKTKLFPNFVGDVMSRATISVINEDGTIETISVRYDGHWTYTGVMLIENYDSECLARSLVRLGDLISIGEIISQYPRYDSELERDLSICKTVSGSLRNKRNKARTYSSFSEFDASDDSGMESEYFYRSGRWYEYTEDQFEDISEKFEQARIYFLSER
jgi:hypothetical protein